jgi:hypothetical protein
VEQVAQDLTSAYWPDVAASLKAYFRADARRLLRLARPDPMQGTDGGAK